MHGKRPAAGESFRCQTRLQDLQVQETVVNYPWFHRHGQILAQLGDCPKTSVNKIFYQNVGSSFGLPTVSVTEIRFILKKAE